MKFYFPIFFLLSINTTICSSQGKLPLIFKVFSDNKNYKDIKIHILKNNSEETIYENRKTFNYDLELNSDYCFIFSKPGYYTKKVLFETAVPSLKNTFIFEPFEFEITLFKNNTNEPDTINPVQVGKVKFNPEFNDFDYFNN